ncbi:25665_t:CDS:2, partial [Racocetra persica]
MGIFEMLYHYLYQKLPKSLKKKGPTLSTNTTNATDTEEGLEEKNLEFDIKV